MASCGTVNRAASLCGCQPDMPAVRFSMYASDPDDAVVPLFAESLRGGGLTHVGTGLFVEFRSQPFLFTAAHVTDNLQHSELWVPAHDSIYPIQGYVAAACPLEQRKSTPSGSMWLGLNYTRYAFRTCHKARQKKFEAISGYCGEAVVDSRSVAGHNLA